MEVLVSHSRGKYAHEECERMLELLLQSIFRSLGLYGGYAVILSELYDEIIQPAILSRIR